MQKFFLVALPRPVLALALLVLTIHLCLLWLAPALVPAASPNWLTGPLILRTLPAEPQKTTTAAVAKPPRQARPRPSEAVAQAPFGAAELAPLADAASNPATPTDPPAQQPALPQAEPQPQPGPDVAEPASSTEPSPTAEPPAKPTAVLALPGSTRLKYDIVGSVRGIDYHASGELLWRHDGSKYDARLQIGAFLLGSRVQTSRGQITDQGLMPKRFSDKVRSEVAAHFEWDKGKIIFSANSPEAPLQPGAQDHLSAFIQLASLLASQPTGIARGNTIELQAVGAREASVWRFELGGFERLKLPGGELDALKLTRPPTHAYDLRAELWMAPALGWLPARIRLSQENGDFVDQQWQATESP